MGTIGYVQLSPALQHFDIYGCSCYCKVFIILQLYQLLQQGFLQTGISAVTLTMQHIEFRPRLQNDENLEDIIHFVSLLVHFPDEPWVIFASCESSESCESVFDPTLQNICNQICISVEDITFHLIYMNFYGINQSVTHIYAMLANLWIKWETHSSLE